VRVCVLACVRGDRERERERRERERESERERERNSVDNTVAENSGIFSQIRMC